MFDVQSVYCSGQAEFHIRGSEFKGLGSTFKTAWVQHPWIVLFSSIKYPASSIKHPVSSIQHPVSSIQHPASSIQHPVSSIQYPASSIQHPASSIQKPATRTKRPQQPVSRILFPDRVTLNRATIIHLWMPVARHLLRPTRKLGRATLKRFPIWSCTGWGLPSFPGHPGNWCALTAPFHPYPAPNRTAGYRAVYFLLHFPSCYHDFTL